MNTPRSRALSLILFCFISVVCSNSFARTWLVKPDGTGEAPTIQAAIDLAANGDIVLLANGTYTGDGNHDIDYHGKAITVSSESGIPDSCIIAFGGEARERRYVDWGPYFRVIEDSDSVTFDIFARASGSSCYGFYFHSGEDANSVLQGVKIAGWCGIAGRNLSSPKVVNCIFSGSIGASLYYSDAVFIDCLFADGDFGLFCQESSPQAYGCTFDGQCGDSVILFFAGYGLRPRPTFEHCTFKNNRGECTLGGGTIWTRSAVAIFRNCTFADNSATGVAVSRDGIEFMDCLFTGNQAYNGGGVYLYNSNANIVRCTFMNNTASDLGGAVFIGDSSCKIDSCTFEGNTARMGGAIACGRQVNDLTIWNSIMTGNTASENGACIATVADYYETRFELSHSTLSDNATDAAGAAVYLRRAEEPDIHNTIIAFSSSGRAMDYDNTNSDIAVFCSNFYGNAGGDWNDAPLAEFAGTNGNFSADPLFCDRDAGLYTLNSASPCLPGNHPEGGDCGLIGALGHGCDPLLAQLDLFPGSCDNHFDTRCLDDADEGNGKGKENDKKGGVLPAAVVGSEDFDVTLVDVSSLELNGVAPLRTAHEDVTRPATSEDITRSTPGKEGCPCTEAGPDGVPDLTLKFSRREIAAALGDSPHGSPAVLVLRGRMADGTPFVARDCLHIVHEDEEGKKPKGFSEIALRHAIPNPFNPATTISFALPEAAHVNLSIFDVQGRHVVSLVNEVREEGESDVHWDGRNAFGEQLASGVYFYRLEAGGTVLTKRLVLVK